MNVKKLQNGFTLIEIIVVVVIVAVLSVLGVQMVSSGSVERHLQQHSRRLQSVIQYACDQATLQNIPYGINFFDKGYVFKLFVNQEWIEATTEENVFYAEIQDGTLLSLELDDQSVVLTDEISQVPQVLCDGNGELTPFKVTFSDASNKHHYLLETIGYWQLKGQWLDAE